MPKEMFELLLSRCSDVFDIALLKLETPLTFNSIVRPVCIPPENFPTTSADTVIATGGGTLGML